MKVLIEEYSDGFAIIVTDNQGMEKRFSFDQEGGKEELKSVFALFTGVQVDYEVIC